MNEVAMPQARKSVVATTADELDADVLSYAAFMRLTLLLSVHIRSSTLSLRIPSA